MKEICKREKCTGCFACYNACPKKCIKMQENTYGFLYPEIDFNQCVNCGKCEAVCPVNNQIQLNKVKSVYAGWSLDESERASSTSGGVAAEISKSYIEKGGVIYGACINDSLEVTHKRISRNEELPLLKQSKYVQSRINDSYKMIQEDLHNGMDVLFVGTSCQVAGLKNYLGKEYDNLLLCDIVCHGVPSYKMLREYIDSVSENKKVTSYKFRNGNEYYFSLFDGDVKINESYLRESTYFLAFMEGLTCRNNCYECRYCTDTRVGDITLGDFWGLGKKIPFTKDKRNGVSLILFNTDKGLTLKGYLEKVCFMEQRTLEEAVEGNMQLREPLQNNVQRKKFEKLYSKKGFNYAVKHCCAKSMIRYKIKKKMQNVWKSFI